MSPGRAAAIRAAQTRMGELGLTQEALAQSARLDLSTVNTFLNGHTWPQVRTRAKIEVALDWTPGELGRIASGSVVPDNQAELKELRERLETLGRDLSAALDQLDRLTRRF